MPSHYGPADSALVLVGDVTLPQAQELANKYFGKWTGGTARRQLPPAPKLQPTHVVIVDKPGAPQSALLRLARVCRRLARPARRCR